ncbi:glutathione synthase [Sporolactobacillus shoreae]|uniref:Glutamate--cysteine ligase n=1 Tax=Sporolactobacillus shoreae TaxID=1465501 RepID=A0A4Z0GN84_9BACL|nr:glutathione synthase [Sporolactobacillus shoreae]TGA98020.1 glutathione synthase [Sporolactobacillus shoreae]
MSEEKCCLAPITTHGRFGLERENLRVNTDGSLALTPHPTVFGDKLTNPEITTDFSESQIELVTPVALSIPQMLIHEERLTRSVFKGISPELLWPLSTPPTGLPAEEQIPIADFGPAGQDKNDYRAYLSNKYGRLKQLYCGIHFNFSFPREEMGLSLNHAADRNHFYLNLAANTMRGRFFLVHLLAASPETVEGVSYRSIRLSSRGYKNTRPVYPDYSTLRAYIASIRSAVEHGQIESPRELYQLIRIKGPGFEDLSSEPDASRIELRIPDLNPFFRTGINPDDLYLMHLYVMWAARQESSPFDVTAQKEADSLSDQAALMTVSETLAGAMNRMFDRLHAFVLRNRLPESYSKALDHAQDRWLNPHLRYAERITTHQSTEKNGAGMFWANQMKDFYLRTAGNRCM